MSKFDSVEEAQKFLSDIENNLKQFEDEGYNLQELINRGKQEIQSIDSLTNDMKRQNFELWSQSTIQQQAVEEIEENEPTISDIIGGIDILWQLKKILFY